MNIVFIHPNFPGQFGYLAEMLGKDKDNKIIFITSADSNKDRQIPGVQKIIFSEKMPEGKKDDPPLKNPPIRFFSFSKLGKMPKTYARVLRAWAAEAR